MSTKKTNTRLTILARIIFIASIILCVGFAIKYPVLTILLVVLGFIMWRKF